MNSLTRRDSAIVWHPFTPLTELQSPVIGATGSRLLLEDGKSLIDAISSWWTNIHGHCHPQLVAALADQAQTLEHVIFAGFTHEPAVALAEEICNALGAIKSRVFYSDNGSTAVEVALKIAIQYWWNQGQERHSIIALSNGYHGDTFGAMSVSGRGLFTSPFGKHLFEVRTVRAPEAGLSSEELTHIVEHFEKLVSSADTATFIFEPMLQGTGGMRVLDPHTLSQMIAMARARQVPVIADEVMTGFFRTGLLFASEYLDSAPDIVCLSKGLTGGMLPLGVTVCANSVADAFNSSDRSKMLFHGHSYTANPLACAVARASLKLCQSAECRNAVSRISASHELFAARLEKNARIAQVRRLGTMVACRLQTPYQSDYLNPLRDKLYAYYHQAGVLLRPLGDVVYLLPPYCMSDAELQYVYDVIERSLRECL